MGQAVKRDGFSGSRDLGQTTLDSLNAMIHEQSWNRRNGVVAIDDDAQFSYNASTKDRLDIPAFHYWLGEKLHYSPSRAALDWDEGGETINTGTAASTLWGAWYLTIDEAGDITATPMDQSGDMAYATEFAALMSINGNSDNTSLPAGEVLFAIVTLQVKASQTFTADTTEFDNGTVVNEVNFYMMRGREDALTSAKDGVYGTGIGGRIVTKHSGVAANSGDAAQFDLNGAAVAHIRGQEETLAAATGGTAFTVADTINTGAAASQLWGVWGIFRDASGNISTLSADGDETASDQTYATEALALAALADLFIPPIYALVGTISVQCAVSDTFTANTEELATSDAAVDAINLTAKAVATAYEIEDQDAATGNENTVIPPTQQTPLYFI